MKGHNLQPGKELLLQLQSFHIYANKDDHDMKFRSDDTG